MKFFLSQNIFNFYQQRVSKCAELIFFQGLFPELERAVIACHGELMPKYVYIEKLRTAEEVLNHMEGYDPKRVRSIKKTFSFCALRLEGHLFRTKALNLFLDVLNQKGVNFNLLDWKIGADATEESSVFLQIFGRESEHMEHMDEIFKIFDEIAKEKKIRIKHTE
jgi:hypothetical protein